MKNNSIPSSVRETHQVAEAQQEKNARLREAFGISEYFVEGSSFDPDRQAKEKLAESAAIQEKEKERQLTLEKEKERKKDKEVAARYQLVHTPSPEREEENATVEDEGKEAKKKKRRRKDRYVDIFCFG